MDEIIKNYREAIGKICEDLNLKIIEKSGQKFNWNDNAFIWFGYLVKEGEKILNKMQYELNSMEFNGLARQLQNIAEEEFKKLKFRIEGENVNENSRLK